jgi:hypothetical protein
MNMTPLTTAPDERTQDLEGEVDIPRAFRRAFEPTPIERAASFLRVVQHSLRGWFERQGQMAWMPRATDPVAELKHVWLGEYGLAPSAFEQPSSRRCRRW